MGAAVAQESPVIVSTVPTNQATGVSPTAPVVFTFNTAMNTNATSVQFVAGTTLPPVILPATASWSTGLTQVTCTPIPPFPTNQMIIWVVTGEDQSGNALQEPTSGSFTTGTGSAGSPATTAAGLASRGEQDAQLEADLFQTNALEIIALAGVDWKTNVTIVAPPPSGTNTLDDSGIAGLAEFSDTEANALSFATNYAVGTYRFRWATMQGIFTASLNLTDGALPATPQVTNWHDPMFAILGQPWRVQWTIPAGGAAVDYVRLRVEQNGALLFATPLPGATGALTGASNTVEVPAGVLTNKSRCTVTLTAFSFIAQDTNSVPGVTLHAARHRTVTFDLRMADPSVPPPTLLTTNLASLPSDSPVLTLLRVTNGVQPLSFTLLSGGLPAGLSLEADGSVSGQTTSLVSTTATVQVTDLLGRSSTGTVNLTVAPPDPVVPPPAVTNVLCATPSTVDFDLLGSAGAQYTVERSVDWTNWTTFLVTNAASARFSLQVPIDAASAFFRVRGPGTPPPPSPHPLTVAPVRNTNAVASARLDEFGGTLNLTNSAGYVFALNLPAGALDRSELVTMTEVTQVGGLPLSGGLLAAVDLQPEGILFSVPARLDITAPANVDTNSILGFGAANDGSQFALQPAFNTNRTTSLYLWHFSLAGAGQGTAANAQAQIKNAPDDPVAAYMQQAAAVIQACKADPNCGLQSNGELCEVFKNMADNIVLPKLNAAVADDSVIDDAFRTWLVWWKKIAILGLFEGDLLGNGVAHPCLGDSVIIAANLATTALRNAIEKACERCMDHEIWEIRRMIKFCRWAALLSLNQYESRWIECAQKCLVFELNIDSEVIGTQDGYVLSAHAKGKAKLHPFANDDMAQLNHIAGSGRWPITDHQESDPGNGCIWFVSPAPGTLQFPYVHIDLYRERVTYVPGKGAETNYVVDPKVFVWMGSELSLMPKEHRVVVCPEGSGPVPDLFGSLFKMLHNWEDNTPAGSKVSIYPKTYFEFTDFTGPDPGDFVMTKSYSRTESGATENTRIELRHTPEK